MPEAASVLVSGLFDLSWVRCGPYIDPQNMKIPTHTSSLLQQGVTGNLQALTQLR